MLRFDDLGEGGSVVFRNRTGRRRFGTCLESCRGGCGSAGCLFLLSKLLAVQFQAEVNLLLCPVVLLQHPGRFQQFGEDFLVQNWLVFFVRHDFFRHYHRPSVVQGQAATSRDCPYFIANPFAASEHCRTTRTGKLTAANATLLLLKKEDTDPPPVNSL